MFVDCDMHLFEPRDMWASHLDATRRDLALRLEDRTECPRAPGLAQADHHAVGAGAGRTQACRQMKRGIVAIADGRGQDSPHLIGGRAWHGQHHAEVDQAGRAVRKAPP